MYISCVKTNKAKEKFSSICAFMRTVSGELRSRHNSITTLLYIKTSSSKGCGFVDKPGGGLERGTYGYGGAEERLGLSGAG